MSQLLEAIYTELKQDIASLRQQIADTRLKTVRAETAGGVRAFTYADAPRAAQGGMSDGSQYIDLIWISNGRKSGEAAGAGTGQLCYYDQSIDDYRRVRDDTVVTI